MSGHRSRRVGTLERRIRAAAPPGTTIPKPAARSLFTVKGDGMRRDEPALIYRIPNHSDPQKPYEKGVTYRELERAHEQLHQTGELTSAWFRRTLAACHAEGSCNFTTVGGLFELLGEADYDRNRRGVYIRRHRSG